MEKVGEKTRQEYESECIELFRQLTGKDREAMTWLIRNMDIAEEYTNTGSIPVKVMEPCMRNAIVQNDYIAFALLAYKCFKGGQMEQLKQLAMKDLHENCSQ